MNTPWVPLDLWPLLWWVRCHSGLVENKSALYSLKQTSISVSETSCWVWFIRLTSNKWLWFITTAAWCQIMKTSMYFCRLFEDELLSSADVKQHKVWPFCPRFRMSLCSSGASRWMFLAGSASVWTSASRKRQTHSLAIIWTRDRREKHENPRSGVMSRGGLTV